MRLQGETWEQDIYPILLGSRARYVRSVLPAGALVSAATAWLRFGKSIFSTPYFAAVEQSGSLVLPETAVHSFLCDHLRFIARFYLEMAEMIEARREVIKPKLLRRLELRLGGLEAALSAGRGVLVPTIQTSVPLRILFANFPRGTRYNLLLHRQNAGIPEILRKADQSWNFLFLEDAPGRHVINALRRGEVVICNIDHAYPKTEVTLAPVLGHAAIVPSGVFRVAHRFGSLVVPLTFAEEGGKVMMSAETVFDWNATDELPVAQMLERIQPILDQAVLRAPACWFGWGNLTNRWRAWKELCP